MADRPSRAALRQAAQAAHEAEHREHRRPTYAERLAAERAASDDGVPTEPTNDPSAVGAEHAAKLDAQRREAQARERARRARLRSPVKVGRLDDLSEDDKIRLRLVKRPGT